MNAERGRVPTDTHTITLFRCERRALSLTKSSCAASFLSTERKRPDPWEGRWHCLACPMGAAHAGKPVAEARACGTVEALRSVCPRCLRSAPRLINGRFCVSCFNRHREAQKGRNAKGHRPRLCARLHTEVLAVLEGGNTRHETFDSVIGPVEAMLLATKRARGPIAFGRPPVVLNVVAA